MQEKMKDAFARMEIYQFEACPFCVKVRRFLQGAGLDLPLRDAKTDPYRSELLREGGRLQVPCLKRIAPDGSVQWMYESNDIIAFLRAEIGRLGA